MTPQPDPPNEALETIRADITGLYHFKSDYAMRMGRSEVYADALEKVATLEAELRRLRRIEEAATKLVALRGPVRPFWKVFVDDLAKALSPSTEQKP